MSDQLCAVCGFTIYRDRAPFDPGMPGQTFSHVLPAYERSMLHSLEARPFAELPIDWAHEAVPLPEREESA